MYIGNTKKIYQLLFKRSDLSLYVFILEPFLLETYFSDLTLHFIALSGG